MERRPTSLIREDEDQQPQFEANANNISNESLDCGIIACGCCNTTGCQKLGTTKSFLTVLIFAGIVQGGVEAYFKIATRQAALEHDYDPVMVDWLLVTSGIAQGFLAIVIAYWGNRIHKVAWLGGLLMLQAVACFTLILPTVTHNEEASVTIKALDVEAMCVRRENEEIDVEYLYGDTTLGLLFVVQIAIAFGNVAFHCLGLSYLDDNLKEHESPSFIGAALASRFLGSQFGMAIALVVGATPLGWWLGWMIISPVLFLIGFIIVLFPQHLLSTVVRRAADDIIDTCTNSQISVQQNKWLDDVTFLPSLRRLLTNKILIFNIIAAVFVQTGLVNFNFHEQNYLQSRFFLPTSDADGINDEWTSRLITNLLKPPLVALAIVVAGLIIAKANPAPRKLAGWNIITGLLAVILFIGYIFIDCKNGPIAGAYRGKLTKPYCASSCVCPQNVPFSPVCPENSVFTYYSPCHAGCSSDYTINHLTVFSNCTCGVDTETSISGGIATNGACGMAECQKYWIIFQVLTVLMAALLGSGLIGKLIITIRSVLPQDKALALSLELSLLGLFVYIPGNVAYQAIANSSCQYWSPDQRFCYLHESPFFGNVINILTLCLILVGIIFDILVFLQVKDLPLYGNDEPEDAYRPIQMHRIVPNAQNQFHEQYRSNFYRTNLDPTSPSESLMPNSTPENSPIITSIQNSQHAYTRRSTSPAISSASETYAKVIKQIPTIHNDDEDEPLDFESATSEQRTLESDDDGLGAATNTMRDYKANDNNGYPRMRSRVEERRPLSPETDF